MSRLVPLFAVAATVLGIAVAPASADNPMIIGNVGSGDAFTIAIGDANGNPITRLDPGTYTLLVHDHSTLHNFHLFGPGIEVATPIDKIGDFTFTVNLTDGTYRFVCDAHSSRMHGSFIVGTPPPPPPPVAPLKLHGGVSATGHASLRLASGATFTKVVQGAVQIAVTDRTTKDGFRLVGPHGVIKSTGVAFRGTVIWKLALAPGRYFFGTVKHSKVHAGGFTVAPKS